MVAAIGVDLVANGRIAATLSRNAAGLLRRAFTLREAQEYHRRAREHSKDHAVQFVSSRWAIKEATLKALRSTRSLTSGAVVDRQDRAWHVRLRDIETEQLCGAPTLALSQPIRDAFVHAGVTRAHVSVSHDGGNTIAFVVLS